MSPSFSPTRTVITLGLTGGIGSGKSTACRMLNDMGARVFYADKVAKDIMQNDADARALIRDTFGATSYNEHGSLNRSYLAAQVFSDPSKLEKLNAIVHPLVFDAFEEAKAQAQSDGVEVLVHEAALLFEAGGDAHVDYVAVVTAPDDVRIQRVMQRDDTTERAVRDRMQHQLPQAEIRDRADFIIPNNADRDALRDEVRRLYEQLTTEAKAASDPAA